MQDIADQLDGEWICFEDFLTMLTNSIVLFILDRAMLKLKKVDVRLSLCWIEKEKKELLSIP